MPNIDYNSQSKNYTKLNKRLAGYIKEIQLIFQQLNHEGCKIAIDLTDISDNLDKVLDFSKYPQTKDRLNKLMAKYQKGISSVVVNGMNAEYKKGEINQDTLANNLIERCNNKLPDSAPRLSKKTSTIITSSTDKAKDSFLNRANRGFNLKSKLALQSKEYIKELESAISVAIGKGTDAKTLSKQVTNLFLDYAKLDKEYKLKFGEPIPSKNIQYQAMRLARSEINMAYRDAEQARWRDMPFVLGYEIVLSNNHNCKGVPKGHFYDICDELAGKYPKDFKWLGWHPNCYHKDTKILTNNGWKLFDDVEDNDLIFSLNPNTTQTEWVKFTARQKYFYKGDMIRFYNRSLDCIVTPEHSMVYLDAIGNVCRKNASEFTHHDGSFILDSNTHCISKHFLKEINYYSDYVYDLTLEKNHIFYVSLHGKCFWGSNCRCHAVPIMMTDEQFIKWSNGKQVNAPTIDKMPKQFDKWLEENKDRIERATQRGTLPYFLRDNGNILSIAKPQISKVEYAPPLLNEINSKINNNTIGLCSKGEYGSISDFYKSFGLSESELQNKLNNVIDNSDIYMSIDFNVLTKNIIKGDGFFKSSIEVGKGTFKTIGEERAVKERKMFGMRQDCSIDEFPKYGFLSSKECMSHKGIVGWGYGNVFVKFDRKLAGRSTFTIGDSYAGNRFFNKEQLKDRRDWITSRLSSETSPDIIRKFKNEIDSIDDVISSNSEGYLKCSPASPVNQSNVKSLLSFADEKTEQLHKVKEALDKGIDEVAKYTGTYVECQMYGKVSIHDVVSIEVESKSHLAKLQQLCKKHNLKINITPCKYSSTLAKFEKSIFDYEDKAKQPVLSLSDNDLDNLGDYYINKLAERFGDARNNWWKKINMDDNFFSLLDKVYKGEASIDEKRKYLKMYYEEIRKQKNGKFPKVWWENYRKSREGWTDDIFSELLKKGLD